MAARATERAAPVVSGSDIRAGGEGGRTGGLDRVREGGDVGGRKGVGGGKGVEFGGTAKG